MSQTGCDFGRCRCRERVRIELELKMIFNFIFGRVSSSAHRKASALADLQVGETRHPQRHRTGAAAGRTPDEPGFGARTGSYGRPQRPRRRSPGLPRRRNRNCHAPRSVAPYPCAAARGACLRRLTHGSHGDDAAMRWLVPRKKLLAAAYRTVAVVGPPNSGKTTLFNRLTGLRQKVGNFPGVTVEHHTGYMRDCRRQGGCAHRSARRLQPHSEVGRREGCGGCADWARCPATAVPTPSSWC